MRNIFVFLYITLVSSVCAEDSFKKSVEVFSTNQSFLSDSKIKYFFRPGMSVSGRFLNMDLNDGHTKYFLTQFGYRHSFTWSDYMANVEVFGGFGPLFVQDKPRMAELFGIDTSISRDIFTFFAKYEFMISSKGDENLRQLVLKLSVIPYESRKDSIATHVAIQYQHHPVLIHDAELTPLIGANYKKVGLELGMSTKLDWMLNGSLRF